MIVCATARRQRWTQYTGLTVHDLIESAVVIAAMLEVLYVAAAQRRNLCTGLHKTVRYAICEYSLIRHKSFRSLHLYSLTVHIKYTFEMAASLHPMYSVRAVAPTVQDTGEGARAPYFYKWLGTGGTVKLTKLY